MAEVEEQNQAAAAESPEGPNKVGADGQGGGARLLANKSLYVGDLDVSVTESELHDMFSLIGEVGSTRVCRDAITHRSLGYGYVNFLFSEDAKEALECLNYTPLNGKIIRIMYANRDPTLRRSGAANIIIKNLDKTIESKGLFDTFSTFGTILSCKVVTDDQGQSKGYGFVHFESEEASQTAIDSLNGMLMNGKQVYVGRFVRKEARDSDDTKFTNVYVKNLSDTTTEDDLSRILGEYGMITSAVVMKDGEGKSKCFGFVNYADSDDAAKAMEALNGRKSGYTEWYVGRAQKKSERVVELKAKVEQTIKESEENNLNLYVKNLHDDVDDDKLKELFSEFGTITSHKVMQNPNGTSKGCGFVAFSTADEASRALAGMSNKIINNKPLYVALAQRKEERRKMLQAQFAAPIPVNILRLPTSPIISPEAPSFDQQLGRPPTQVFGHQFLHGQGLPPVQDFTQPYRQGPPPAPLELGQRFFYVQGLPASPLQPRFGYQPQFVPRMRPENGPMNLLFAPHMQPVQHFQRPPVNRLWAGPAQQNQYPVPMMPGSMHRYSGRITLRVPMPGVPGRFPPLPQGTGGLPLHDPAAGQPMQPVPDLLTTLANESPEQQRLILGEKLYPLVEELEPGNVAKITGMILELDLHEVLHLLETPEALKAMVDEAMVVLQRKSRSRQQASNQVVVQLADLSLHDNKPATPSAD